MSVALVTRNRPRSLARCLDSWSRQSHLPAEIVVSDDSDEGQAPDTATVAAQYGCTYTRGPRRGLYANRNHASLVCEGTHIVSADDDHTHPADYLAVASELVGQDPERVWVFAERDPHFPDAPLSCPPELDVSGMGCAPRDPSRCAAIADGSTVYPREIFDSGLRYDESYSFGGLWYLWGKLLASRGWRITFSDRTFVWHNFHADGILPEDGRLDDPVRLRDQLSATTYVQFVNALWIERSAVLVGLAAAYSLKRILVPHTIHGFHVRTTLTAQAAARAAWLAWSARPRYAVL